MIDDIIEWGWDEAPPRRLIFSRDVPRLPRYLPPDADRALAAALAAALRTSPNRLRASALLLRATGMRIGELLDLELDCVHEVPGTGAWLKVPLGKLDTERMVPVDEETLALLDEISEDHSPGRPLPHPRTGKLADFLLTHQGRRISADTLRAELHRAAAGIPAATPHPLRHTATALVNAGCSLQALMALLGHVSAEMSLRYGRLFDATVRGEYERAFDLAKAQLGPVLRRANVKASYWTAAAFGPDCCATLFSASVRLMSKPKHCTSLVLAVHGPLGVSGPSGRYRDETLDSDI